MVLEIRTVITTGDRVVVWKYIWGDGNIPYLDWAGSCPGVLTFQYSLNGIPASVHFTICKL